MRVPATAWRTGPRDWPAIERVWSLYEALCALGFGVVILAGGADRFPPPTYAPLLDLTHGSVVPYGVLFTTAGIVLLLADSPLGKVVGAGCAVLAYSAFCGLFLVAVFKFPDAGSTAWWAYGVLSLKTATYGGFVWLFGLYGGRRRDLGR